jgi:hypothetical protein
MLPLWIVGTGDARGDVRRATMMMREKSHHTHHTS